MSLKAYNDACLRAELFGQQKPDREQFLEKHKHLDVVEVKDEDIENAESAAMLGEKLAGASGGFNELNSILGSTQSRLNRLRGVCGSLTNMLRFKLTSKDNLSYSSEPSYVGQTNYDTDYIPPKPDTSDPSGSSVNHSIGQGDVIAQNEPFGPNDKVCVHKTKADLNTALDDLETMQVNENTSLTKMAGKDMKQQVSTQIDKLDALLSTADRANASMQHQNKQMRSFLR